MNTSVVASWIKDSLATHYFRHLTEVTEENYRPPCESGELIYFTRELVPASNSLEVVWGEKSTSYLESI